MIVGLTFMGFDFIADVDYKVTSYGCDAQTYGPPENCYPAEPPEWEINSIVLYREELLTKEQHRLFDRGHRFTPGFEATGALFDVLANLDAINDAICEEICMDGPPDYSDDDNY